MLTLPEKILFALAVLVSLYFTYVTFGKMAKIVLRGQGKLNVDALPGRLVTGLVALVSQGQIIRHRKVSSIFHIFIAWGFIFYILVNLFDVIEGYWAGFHLPGISGDIYRLLADVLSVAVLAGKGIQDPHAFFCLCKTTYCAFLVVSVLLV